MVVVERREMGGGGEAPTSEFGEGGGGRWRWLGKQKEHWTEERTYKTKTKRNRKYAIKFERTYICKKICTIQYKWNWIL